MPLDIVNGEVVLDAGEDTDIPALLRRVADEWEARRESDRARVASR